MLTPAWGALLLAVLVAGAPSPAARLPQGNEVAQFSFSQRIIIRVPARRSRRYRPAPKPAPPPVYKEKHGPRCISADAVAGAAITGPASVDFILRGGERVRARLDSDCPALDYYSGFYVAPRPDGRICADRDSIRTRSGGECQIDKFRKLVPKSR